MRLLPTTLLLSSLVSLVLSDPSSLDSDSRPVSSRRKVLSPRKHGASVLIERKDNRKVYSSSFEEEEDYNSPAARALRRAEKFALTTPDEDDINQIVPDEDQPFSDPNFDLSFLKSTVVKRQSPAQQSAIVTDTNPVDAAKLADALPNVAGNTHGNDNADGDIVAGDGDESNYPWNAGTYFNPNGVTNSTPAGGWTSLPPIGGFTLNRSLVIKEGAIQPFYITSNYDPAKVKRAVIIMPGKPRDSWKYTTLIGNALNDTVNGNHTDLTAQGVTLDGVIIIGPAWLNQFDQEANATLPNEIIFHGTQWQSGGVSVSPKLNHTITTYEILDSFTDMLFDQAQFPALNQVVIAGHSMGGQMVQRYALLKKTKKYDPNMRFWMGNPGSWAWLTPDRPYPNASCPTPDQWIYGLRGNQTKVSKYARKDVIANTQAVIDRFRGRNVHYALGLLDNGPGDTHCQAVTQGGNHLDRGSQFIMMLGGMPGGFPATHTADFIANVSHQDYPMYSANVSLQHIFADDYNTRYPDLTNVTNPGDKVKSDSNPDGKKAFATPAHEKLAYSLLASSIGAMILAFTILPLIFPASDMKDLDVWSSHAQSPSYDKSSVSKLLGPDSSY